MPPHLPSRAVLTGLEQSASSCCCLHQSQVAVAGRRTFSSTSRQQGRLLTRPRLAMRQWMDKTGVRFKDPIGRPNYLGKAGAVDTSGSYPFPANPYFRSERVLSESAREEIWRMIVKQGEAIKTVSANYGVDMRRVAAVVRLKEVEKAWAREGKKLCTPYAEAVMSMLPQTHFEQDPERRRPHEPINEIHVHSHTMQQIFLPTSESRHFTREDAAKAFGDHILPADKRVPHPELIQLEKDKLAGMSEFEAKEEFERRAMASEVRAAEKEKARKKAEQARLTKVQAPRFEFRFEDVNVDDAGKDGRSRKGTGWRYGMPFYDRRRGEVKIPTKVE